MRRSGCLATVPIVASAVASLALVACVGSSAPARTAKATTTEAASPLVGRWMQVHTCDQLVSGLEAYGLGATAPAVAGDYFPDASVKELAPKPDVCSGAKPQRHFHFFDATGRFGSLDQHQQQVDDGTYVLGDAGTVEINDGTFDFTVSGDQLTLVPEITDAQRREALAKPYEFSTAGWMVAVSYPGTIWTRVACDRWC